MKNTQRLGRGITLASVGLLVVLQACGGGAPPKSVAEVKAACGDWSAWECKGSGEICGATCKAADDVQIGCQGSGCARKSGTFSNASCASLALNGVQGCDRCKAAATAGCF